MTLATPPISLSQPPTSAMHSWLGNKKLWCVALLLFGLLIRVETLRRQCLWADEFFSLAIATGHSLEHSPAVAKPELGDYVEVPDAMPIEHWRAYARHDNPIAGPARVVRAVDLSDTNPPLYYLALWAWTIVFGTSDYALRSLSIAFTIASVPILLSLARQLCGRRSVLPVAILFTLSPLGIHYSTEGRMYAMLWFFTIATAWLTVRLSRVGFHWLLLAGWIFSGAAGMMTHYFFAFVWAPMALWLLLYAGRLKRGYLIVGIAVTLGLILPWYVRVPASLSAWRVTREWLTVVPRHMRTQNFARLLWSFVSPDGVWGEYPWTSQAAWVIFIGLAVFAFRRTWRPLLARRGQFLWLWMLGACAGPLVMDTWRGTYTAVVSRYAVAGFPAALLIVGLVLARVQPVMRAVFLTMIVLVWLPGMYLVAHNGERMSERFRDFGIHITKRLQPDDVIIVHSTPSGVIGMSRALGDNMPIPVASWVPQLGLRHIPQDLERLTAGKKRVILVIIHQVNEQQPQRAWLLQQFRLQSMFQKDNATILYFERREPTTQPTVVN